MEVSILSRGKKVIKRYSAYRFFSLFHDIDIAKFGGLYSDVDLLPWMIFWWLQCIRPSYLVYQSGNMCELSPYFLSRFAR